MDRWIPIKAFAVNFAMSDQSYPPEWIRDSRVTIMKGDRSYISFEDEHLFWFTLDRCWEQAFHLRSVMSELVQKLENMKPSIS